MILSDLTGDDESRRPCRFYHQLAQLSAMRRMHRRHLIQTCDLQTGNRLADFQIDHVNLTLRETIWFADKSGFLRPFEVRLLCNFLHNFT